MDTTLSPKQTDPPHVLFGRADQEIAHAYEQIRQVTEEMARAEEQLSRLEHEAATRDDRPSRGGRAVRGFMGLALAACIGVADFVWQSPSYSDAARPIIARCAPLLVPVASPMLECLPAQPSPPAVQASAAKTVPSQPAPLAQPEIVAPTAAARRPN